MRAFLLACLATVLLGVGAALVLNSGYLPNSASAVFTTPGVRL
jgi:uncharacterized membrane protein